MGQMQWLEWMHKDSIDKRKWVGFSTITVDNITVIIELMPQYKWKADMHYFSFDSRKNE